MKTEFETDDGESSGEEDAEQSLMVDHEEKANVLHQVEGDDEEQTADSQEDEEDEDFKEVPAMRLKAGVDDVEDEDEDDDEYDDDKDVTDHEDEILIKPLTVPPKNIATSKMIKPKTVQATETKPARPSTQQMVDTAIKTLNDRTGSSVQAIRNFIVANYPHVDDIKIRTFIKKYVRTAVVSGKLIQTKGTGATGSFKLSVKTEKDKASQKAKKTKQEQKGRLKVKAKILVKQKKEEVGGKKAAMEVKTAAVKETKAKPAVKQPQQNLTPTALPTAPLKAKKSNKEPIKKTDDAMATKDALTAKKSKLSPSVDQLTNGKGAKVEAAKTKKPNLQRKNLNISISKQPPRPKTAAKGKSALVPANKSPAQSSKKGATKKVLIEATNENSKSKEVRVEAAALLAAAAAAAASKPSSKAKKK